MNITIKEYLRQKGIPYKEINNELITKCVFCNKENHLYFNADTGQYDCKKCGEQGNLFTLMKHFKDKVGKIEQKKFDTKLVEKYHEALPAHIIKYLNNRGIDNDLINQFKIGYGDFYGKKWITIPIKDKNGNFSFLKLRKCPNDINNKSKYKFYPAGANSALFKEEQLKNNKDMIMICEGEFDCILLQKAGIPAITSTAGVNTFKNDWFEKLKELKKIYICFDKDEAGIKGRNKLIKKIKENLPNMSIYKTILPDRMTNGKDITDYFVKNNGNPDELIYRLSKQVAGDKPIDVSQFKPITPEQLINVLGITIKMDDSNKLTTFLCQLSAYTKNTQFNISLNAPSSTGKSYIPLEIAKLFPKEDVVELGYCSPAAFFHSNKDYNKERNEYTIDLSRKIIIFIDQPHAILLERLRPLLSHDKKIIESRITDKSQVGGLKTKNVLIKGYPSVIFCSAGLKIDEQESTRFILLSPEMSQEKIKEGISAKLQRENNKEEYNYRLKNNKERILLKKRIKAIKAESIDNINIKDTKVIETKFMANKSSLKPRHQRDISRVISLIKVFALLNVWFREKTDNTIIANREDIDNAFDVWSKVSKSQEHNLPPYVYNFFQDIILPEFQEKNKNNKIGQGLTRQDIIQKHYQVYGNMIEDYKLRQQILPMLETAELITQKSDKKDGRKILVYPLLRSGE